MHLWTMQFNNQRQNSLSHIFSTFPVNTLHLHRDWIGSLDCPCTLRLARSRDYLGFPLLRHSAESRYISLLFCGQENALLRLRIVKIVVFLESLERNVKTKDVALTTP